MARGGFPESAPRDQMRSLIPVFALIVAILAVATDPSSEEVDLVLAALPVAAFLLWTRTPRMPLLVLALGVAVPAVVAQRSGDLEPLFFEVSLLGYVIGRSAPARAAVGLGVLVALSPVAASLIQDPSEIAWGIWIIGIAFPWVLGRKAAREERLAAQLDSTLRELADQRLLAERRRIARDVHDFVGHGLAAVMLQVTSARHVLRRDLTAAEEALRSAEEVGRRSMQELRRTVGVLRSDGELAAAAPLASATEIAALVEQARAGGLDVKLRARGDLSLIAPSVGVALYRISQEALANAARHAPRAHTTLAIEMGDGRASLVAETTGPTAPERPREPGRPHYGLIGMRERATALGGELSAGPTAEGWLVSCWVPLASRDAMLAGDGANR